MFGQKDKVALFVDGSNFFESVKEVGLRIDYQKVYDFFARRETVFRAHYFSAVKPDSPEKDDDLRPLLDWLSYHNWDVITKPVKMFTNRETGEQDIKGNMDVEITTEMLLLKDHVNHMVLFSGDEDFVYAIQKVKAAGVRVTVVSSPKMVASNLRRIADLYINLETVFNDFSSRGGRGVRARG